jgi:diguanylate cyclase (GGDEF)-like protein/PAS domain S-box-containing protein
MNTPAISYTLAEQPVLLDEIATRNVVCLSRTDSIGEAARIMAEKRISSIVIADGAGHPEGILTERDVLRAMQSGLQVETALQIVMSSPVVTVPATMNSMDAYRICTQRGIRHLVMVDGNGVLTGLVSETDFRLHLKLTALAGLRPVTSVMRRSTISLPPEASLQEALDLMQSLRYTCIVVIENKFPVGIVTERDVVRFYSRDPKQIATPLREIMAHPVLTTAVDTCINKAAELMSAAKIRHLVVVDASGNVAGLISEHDLTLTAMLCLVDEKLETNTFLRTLINTIPDLVWLKSPDGIFLACNPPFERMIGAKEAEIVGKTDYDFLSKELADAFQKHDLKAMTGGTPCINEAWLDFAVDGYRGLFETVKTPMRDKQGSIIGILGIARDISALKKADENQRLAASVFDNCQEAILIADTDNKIVAVNHAFTQITGYSKEDVIGQNPKLLNSGRQSKAFYSLMWQSLQRYGLWRGEIWNRRKSGEIYAELLSIATICDDNGKIQRYVAVFSDISMLKEHEAELNRAANYDALTGVPNRRLLTDRLQQAIARTQHHNRILAICYMDLDGFKHINDQYGHEVGDQLLMEVTQRLQQVLRAEDTLARLGGDEFVLLLNGRAFERDYYPVLDRILSIVATPINYETHELALSASVGVTFYPNNNADGDTLLRHADQAMYIAKQTGKNQYHLYDTEYDQRINSLQAARKRFVEGLEDGELELFYQPKIELRTRRMIGVEALIRWRHPERGLLSPGAFLPILENSDLEILLGEWVTDSALAQLSAWNRDGIELEVGINISTRHLQSSDFVQRLAHKMARYPELPHNRLQIEILETAALEDFVQSTEAIKSCRKLGVSFALDDFGTGYSSLAYLRKLSVEVLKIDQSFVSGMLTDEGDRAIVEGIIALAKTFGRKTVAEGIDRPELIPVLADIGCTHGQGYGIARPMPVDMLMAWYENYI